MQTRHLGEIDTKEENSGEGREMGNLWTSSNDNYQYPLPLAIMVDRHDWNSQT